MNRLKAIDLETLDTVTGGSPGCARLSRELARTAAESYPVGPGINPARRENALLAFQAANERACEALGFHGIAPIRPF
jgi:hypothetical protein